MLIVSDASPLHYLVLIQQVDVLPQLFGQVITTAGVIEELTRVQAPAVVRS